MDMNAYLCLYFPPQHIHELLTFLFRFPSLLIVVLDNSTRPQETSRRGASMDEDDGPPVANGLFPPKEVRDVLDDVG